AEDGIRDGHVTGVQTCALPICLVSDVDRKLVVSEILRCGGGHACLAPLNTATIGRNSPIENNPATERWVILAWHKPVVFLALEKIGRASCRERGECSAQSVPVE